MVETHRRSAFRLDEVPRGVRWARSTDPTAFPLPGSAGIRGAEADPIRFGPSTLPRLRNGFRLDGRRVFLEYVEPDAFDDEP